MSHTTAYRAYVLASAKHHEMLRLDYAESALEVVEDELDGPWYAMREDEREKARLTGYCLYGPPAGLFDRIDAYHLTLYRLGFLPRAL